MLRLRFLSTVKPRECWMLTAILIMGLAISIQPIARIIDVWWDSAEYGHGLFMPFVAGYIVWLNRAKLRNAQRNLVLLGYVALVLSFLLMLASALANLESVKLYALLSGVVAFFMVLYGRTGLSVVAIPALLMFLVIPLPYLLISQLTAGLQLISSEMGTWFIRLFGYPVFLEGNLIDMGQFKLAVVEACSGLRYLFPLSSFAVLVAYFARASLMFKVALVMATIPVTIFMNSLRIAITGVLVNTFGNEVAEGFLHDFEGWVVFLAALSVMSLIVFMYGRIILKTSSLHQMFDFDERGAGECLQVPLATGSTTTASIALITIGLLSSAVAYSQVTYDSYIPERAQFNEFPSRLVGRSMQPQALSAGELEILKPDDYLLANYSTGTDSDIGLYMIYYREQKEGSALHSPQVCIPGGGWTIVDDTVHSIELSDGSLLAVNRVIIQKGDVSQVVYYWIDQMGVTYTNEYLARASLLKSATFDQRSDGALLRVNTLVRDGDYGQADRALDEFVKGMYVFLPDFLPS